MDYETFFQTELDALKTEGRYRVFVRGVGALDQAAREEAANHHLHLVLLGVAGADHGLLHRLGAVLGDRNAEQRRRQQRDAAGIAELEGRRAVAVDVGLLDRGLIRPVLGKQGGQRVVEMAQAVRDAVGGAGGDGGAISVMTTSLGWLAGAAMPCSKAMARPTWASRITPTEIHLPEAGALFT